MEQARRRILILEFAGLSRGELGRRARVSGSTISRVANGATDRASSAGSRASWLCRLATAR
jgi:hypothetical protein